MKILLVEDDVRLVESLRPKLKKAGYVIEWSDNGIDGEFMAMEENFDGIILDLGLPQKPGLDVLKTLRLNKLDTPVLILTARDSWQERVDGLKAGADDYVGKPFHFEELLARLEAILRRRFGQTGNTLEHQNLVLDLDQQTVNVDNQSIQLTAIEFRLLRYLMSNPGKIISKSVLSEHIYEEDQLKDSNVIEVYINRLRHLFGKSLIKTYRGQGYQLVN
ncbi:MAG: response regulator transcription factor [Gammaproteobacteria bacterium]|nr:response regulator transcription factor [Gammaproteobacteria bacterium]MBT3724345.1 response regulator transcription factor [Gammaproteobacteria bacterium]MBT4076102.1 response regulator transcription factor [Gammaproteobacteria bacterium]MBT4193608.1 response regulator transcription factor [Gammaproteobacteria bacterium]MBT4452049.1 response regulator transcription factor [Gammaproteobacteria bacterium]